MSMKASVLLLLLTGAAASCARPHRDSGAPLDILVFGPHPDDAVIGCTGVMVDAIRKGARVGVVVVTNGDGYPRAAAQVAGKSEEDLVPDDFFRIAAIRQRQSRTALKRVGVRPEDHLFLGYPDSVLKEMHDRRDESTVRQPFTQKNETYGADFLDYHSLSHGRPSPYAWAAAVRDAAEIIASRRPGEIYVTDSGDRHPDHQAAFFLVRDAVRKSGHRGPVFTYLVHGTAAKASSVPESRPLSDELVEFKRDVLREYAKNLGDVHDDLHLRARPTETFWRVRIE